MAEYGDLEGIRLQRKKIATHKPHIEDSHSYGMSTITRFLDTGRLWLG